jgi:hypothetical protein
MNFFILQTLCISYKQISLLITLFSYAICVVVTANFQGQIEQRIQLQQAVYVTKDRHTRTWCHKHNLSNERVWAEPVLCNRDLSYVRRKVVRRILQSNGPKEDEQTNGENYVLSVILGVFLRWLNLWTLRRIGHMRREGETMLLRSSRREGTWESWRWENVITTQLRKLSCKNVEVNWTGLDRTYFQYNDGPQNSTEVR